ncbi:propionyl-CoA synthetase [Hydrocarboniclastica marina]|uniref:Propionyl-CoA synthetase n=1 Tax=Hydrocarboniclastica marina TaxID=2259620 RepID=A0A4P7XGP1_9ALTE|nr:propionyl-CoA synthetase [Hydrocarboniclastica marina]MAL98439.1 propionyl-CoA synthetase [Alteromonadaceae bacterium]QCF25803.1 propionyl-CoA synthetase [Hydrocarboniclastica marina]|tara:strand:+ start:1109 stop:3010 length:1902 start_codon:yes stop_codon:yes gene_type:complete
MARQYEQEYQRSIKHREAFWREKSALISWYERPEVILSKDEHNCYRWYADGELNTAYLALDYHVENGRGDQPALIYDSPVTGSGCTYTYAELTQQTAQFAGVLSELGVGKGDRVIIYMPMVPEAVIAMLACARIGAVHSVVFGGFAANELAVRIDDARPKVILSASCGIEVDKVIAYKPLLDRAVEAAGHKPDHCVILQREQERAAMKPARDHDWNELMAKAKPVDPVPVIATDPLYILYTSGTTGKPKGVVRDNGGHAVAMRYSMELIYDVGPGDVFWAASDVGWVVGHSYIVYAPLITGCTTVLYEGKPVNTPDAGAFWRVCAEHKVKVLFTAPTAFRAMRKADPEAKLMSSYDLGCLERIYLAGERLDPPTYDWLREKTGLPVYDHWWQTETAWAIAGNPVGLGACPVKPGSATLPAPGYAVHVLDSQGNNCEPLEQGSVVIKLPLPPGCLPTVWGDPQRFQSAYLDSFPGYYMSGDGGYFDEDGYLFIMGRTDDVINVAGHRLSTGEMEEVIARHPAVAECAVIGISDELKGQVPVGLVLLKNGVNVDPLQLEADLITRVRDEVGAVASFKHALVVERLPKTRSGKILRRVLRDIADGMDYKVPSTIDDPAILDEIHSQFSTFRRRRMA